MAPGEQMFRWFLRKVRHDADGTDWIWLSGGTMREQTSATTPKASSKFLNEKPVARFCVGFCTFGIAEILVYMTLRWIFSII
jgi:hypothetical protein